MKIGTIGMYTFIRHIKDYKAMAAFIVFPILVIVLLGTALDSLFTPKTIDPMKLGIYSEDKGFIEQSLQQFFTSDELSEQLEISQATSVEAGIDQVKSDQWDALLYVGANTSEALQQGTGASLVLYSKSTKTFAQPLLEIFIRSYHLNTVLPGLSPVLVDGLSNEPIIQQIKMTTEGRIARGLDYYAVTIMLQSLLFGALFGVFAVTKDLTNRMHSRLLTTPVRSSAFIAGKLLGSTSVVFTLALFILAVTKFAFQSNWSGNVAIILSVLLLFSLFAAALGMLLGYLTRSSMISSLITFILSTAFTRIAGGFAPIKGGLMEQLGKLSPNSYAQDALFATIYEDQFAASSFTVLTVFAVCTVCLTILSGRRRTA